MQSKQKIRRPEGKGAPKENGFKLPYAVRAAIADILMIGVCICIYAYFHHVRQVEYADVVDAIAPMSARASTGAEPTPAADGGLEQGFGARFPDKFSQGTTSGANEDGTRWYQSPDVNITLTPHLKKNSAYYVADIYIRNIENLRTAFAKNKYGRSIEEGLLSMAREHSAILSMTGDYYGVRSKGVVLRNGTLYRKKGFRDACVLYRDGTMRTYSSKEMDADKAVAEGAYQIWSFGPRLLRDGQPMKKFDSDVLGLNPRAAIGYYEPGHYCFVVVDGRQDGYAKGMTMQELSQLMYDLGCAEAYNLDGGQSAMMAWGEEYTNRPYQQGRAISDMIYIGEVR